MDANQLEQLRQIEEMKKQLLAKILTKDAQERLGRVRMVNPQLAGQAELYLIQVYQAGKLKTQITDDKLREVLKTLSGKKEISIKRL
ncbi:MAG: DNA-binding protein [Candidatus Aenigmatarchaeota archaeon]